MIGFNINQYEILALLGEGGMGNVYLAEDKKVGRKVAIKIILPHLAKNEHVRDRFIMEAKTMARLQHVNIVTLYDYVVNDEGLFLIMEYVDGNPLDEYMKNIGKAIDEDLAIEVTKQVVSACNHAHSKGVVHRDIKPGNIIINKEGTVKILDFGIAKIIDEEVSKLTKTGLQIGTVYYMSPEQVQGSEITAKTDIYSIGVTLYQMVTAINPYKQFSTEFQIYKKIVDEPLPDVRDIHSELSPFINMVIQKATEKKPENRFKNCEEFFNTLSNKAEYLSKQIVKNSEPINEIWEDEKLALKVSLFFILFVGLIFYVAQCNETAAAIATESEKIKKESEYYNIGKLQVMKEDLLLYGSNEMTLDDAYLVCKDLGDGWRLPTIDELRVLYRRKVEIGGFNGSSYWSSSVHNDVENYGPWIFNFNQGLELIHLYNGYSSVRSVRTF